MACRAAWLAAVLFAPSPGWPWPGLRAGDTETHAGAPRGPCWDGYYNYDFCCDVAMFGPRGQQRCWTAEFTFERCCTGRRDGERTAWNSDAALRTRTVDDLAFRRFRYQQIPSLSGRPPLPGEVVKRAFVASGELFTAHRRAGGTQFFACRGPNGTTPLSELQQLLPFSGQMEAEHCALGKPEQRAPAPEQYPNIFGPGPELAQDPVYVDKLRRFAVPPEPPPNTWPGMEVFWSALTRCGAAEAFVNFGAGNMGDDADPLKTLLPLGLRALLVEPGPAWPGLLATLADHGPRRAVGRDSLFGGRLLAVHAAAEPPTVGALLARWFRQVNVTREVGILKVDIDSYDCALLEAALHFLEPAAVWLEVAWDVPPPVRFARGYSPEWAAAWARLSAAGIIPATAGCSLSFAASVLGPRYGLWGVDPRSDRDALFVRQDMLECAGWRAQSPFHVYAGATWRTLWAPESWVREWLFHEHEHEAVVRIWANFTAYDRALGLSHIPLSILV